MKIYLVSRIIGSDGIFGRLYYEPIKAFYDRKLAEVFIDDSDYLSITELDIEGIAPPQDSLASAITAMFK